jgi:NADH:ubiquinone oxidoreductase subunit F (NADH-binding)
VGEMTAISQPAPSGLASGALPRLLQTPQLRTLAGHLDRFGPPPSHPADLIGEVERSGLRGRGGAGFPTAVKLAAVASRRRTIVVANGTEGEPASAKDKTLLAVAPHLVYDGAVLAAHAVGAQQVFLCVERSATSTLEVLEAALVERRNARIDTVEIRLAATPSRYVAGEESALVHWLNGGEAKPTLIPPRPFERGVTGRPTLVDNVETLAHLALIARYGADWFRALGTVTDPGTMLLTLSGAVGRPGVYEAPLGAPLRDVLGAAGGSIGDLGAVLVGGYFGTWIPAAMAAEVDLSVESLGRVGAGLGCGVLAGLPLGACGLVESARVARWLADQSAGQCGPCVFGLDAIASAMDVLVRGDVNGQAEHQLGRWLGMVKGRGACRHPDGAARFVASSLSVFADEIALHRRRGPCRPTAGHWLPVPRTGGWR